MQIKQKGVRFSKNIFTDKESSFISNPEYVAEHMAQTIQRLGNYHVGVELCCCIGMNVIQMAKVFEKMIGIDLNKNRIDMARKNAQLYGVSSNTEFIVGDVLNESLLSTIHADFAILDPEWSARLMDRSSHVSSIYSTNPSLKSMFDLTKKYITPNIVARIPRTFNFETLAELGTSRMENIIIHDEVMFRIAYFFENIHLNVEEDVVFE